MQAGQESQGQEFEEQRKSGTKKINDKSRVRSRWRKIAEYIKLNLVAKNRSVKQAAQEIKYASTESDEAWRIGGGMKTYQKSWRRKDLTEEIDGPR